MGLCEDMSSGGSHGEVAKLSLSVSPIMPLAYILCGIPARIGDFAELAAWYQGVKDSSKVFIDSPERSKWRGPRCGHQFRTSPFHMSLMLGHPVCPICEPRQYSMAFNLGCSSLGIPPSKALFLATPPRKTLIKTSRWINDHRSTSQPLVTVKGIRKAHNQKTDMTVSVVLQDGRTVFLLVYKFVAAIFDRFGDIDEVAISHAIVKRKKEPKQGRKWNNTPPIIMVPGVKEMMLLQGQPLRSSFEKHMSKVLHNFTSMAVIINARGVLPGNYELDAWIPDLGIAFEWDAGGDATHPPERREHKDRLAKDMGITVYHVNPTKRYPMQFLVANVRRAVRAAEKRLAQRLLDKK